jgi:hypothetical protein
VGSAAPAEKNLLESCTRSDVCKNSYCGGSGVCEPLQGDGGTCQVSEQCMPGYACKTTGTSNTCQQAAPTNGPCAATYECASQTDVCTGGMCKPGGLTGFGCSASDGCQFLHQCENTQLCALPPTLSEDCMNYPFCTTGYCDNFSHTCLDKKANGDNCSATMGGTECQSGYCDTTIPNSTCAMRPICI